MSLRAAGLGLALALLLGGCSATSLLSSAIGTKPDISAQVGAENTKQTLGVNSKVDTSTTTKTEVKDSTVGSLDTSSKKQSISTGTVTAETLQVINNDSTSLIMACLSGAGIVIVMLLVYFLVHWLLKRKDTKDVSTCGTSN